MAKKLTMLSMCFAILLSIQGCGDSNIDLVKNGNFPRYPNVTIGKFLDGSFSNTKWSSQETSKGEIRVMFEGAIPQKMHNAFKEQALRFIHADATKGWVKGVTSNYDKYLLHARTAGVLSAVIGDDKIPRDFMSEFRRDCSRQSANLQEGSQPWNELLNECAGTLENAINKAFDELYWKEGDTVFFEWAIHSSGKSFELTRFGAATMPTGLSLDHALKAIYSVE